MKFEFNLHREDEFSSKLRRIEAALGGVGGRGLRPLYKTWGIETVKWIQENYRSGGRGIGKRPKWRRLTPMTIRSRRKKSRKPLLNTGHLMRQWNYRVKSWGVVVGNPMDIAEYHEKGTEPYTIKPVDRKVLWFGVTPAQRRRGQQLGGHAQHRIVSKPYKRWGKGGPPGVFAKIVNHPGLPKRRQLPKEDEIFPTLLKVTDIWLNKVIKE